MAYNYYFKAYGTGSVQIEQGRTSGRFEPFISIARREIELNGERVTRVVRTGADGVAMTIRGDFDGLLEG